MQRHPELRDKPLAVCGSQEERHGIVLAANYIAKPYGVKTGMAVWQARQRCPHLVMLPPDMGEYIRFSQMAREIYEDYTDQIEPFGLDENWLDVTGSVGMFGSPMTIAREISDRMKFELGITCSIGVADNKITAKLGSDYKKPDATTCITRENFRQMVWPLPVGDLLYVGRAAAETMKKFGVRTIGDLARFDRESLFHLLGRHGAQLHDYANGLDRAPVAPAGQYTPPKSVGSGNTFARNLTGREEFQAGVGMLAGQVAARLRRHRMKCTGVALQIRDPDFRDLSRQKRLEVPTCLGREIARAAMELAEGCWTMERPVRALTVTAIALIPEEEASVQQTLFSGGGEEKRARLERLARTTDAIRAKYGPGAIGMASEPRDAARERHAPPPSGAGRGED